MYECTHECMYVMNVPKNCWVVPDVTPNGNHFSAAGIDSKNYRTNYRAPKFVRPPSTFNVVPVT